MKKDELGKYLLVISAVLVLLSTYLAIFHAPLPSTSVQTAGEILSSLEGSEITVAGFVADVLDVYHPPMTDASERINLTVADFADYERYRNAISDGVLEGGWWTVRPIDVSLIVGGLLDGPYLSGGLKNGTNVSITGTVEAGVVGPNSAVIGHYIGVSSSSDVTIGGSAGEFSVMNAPVAQKIFFFHMPSAWVSYLAFFVALASSALYLKTRDMKYDRWAISAAELGVLFATIAILTGPVWAKEEWGVYWRWDDTKLITTFVLWLVYIGYLMLRSSMQEAGARARVAAVYGIVGFVTVPMSLLSSRIAPLLRSSHPQVIASSSGGLSAESGLTIGVAVMAFTILFITMLIWRVEIAEAEEELEELKREVGGEY